MADSPDRGYPPHSRENIDSPSHSENEENASNSKRYMPEEKEFFQRLQVRHRRGNFGRLFNFFSVAVAGLALVALLLNVANEAFGTVGVVNTIEPDTLTNGRPLEALSTQELATILAENVGGRLRVLIRDTISQVPVADFTKVTVAEIVADPNVGTAIGNELLKNISKKEQAGLLARYADKSTLRNGWCWKKWSNNTSSQVSRFPIRFSDSMRSKPRSKDRSRKNTKRASATTKPM